MANSSRLCLICGQVFGSDAERRDHIEREHPGQRVEWRDKRPYVVTEGGTATRIGSAALRRMRGNARKVTGGTAAAKGRAVLHRAAPRQAPTPAPEPTVMVETPLPDDPDAPAYFTQAQPFHLLQGGATLPPPDAPADGPTPTVPDPSALASREAIRLVLDQGTLAGMIRNLSVVISEWDGAGERGHLSAIEAGQLAMLLHDPAISIVQRYFGGNVDRFKLALALGILLLGKGRIHLTAVSDRLRERRAASSGELAPEAASYAATQPDQPVAVPVAPAEPEPLDPVAELARRQREWNTTPRESVPA